MSTDIGIGFSQTIDAHTAAMEAAFQAKSNLKTGAVDIAIIFSTAHYDPTLTVPALQSVLSQPKMIGCSTAGIILADAIETRGIAVLTISSKDIKFGAGFVNNLDTQDAHRAGNHLASYTLADFGRHSRQAFLFLVDGHLENNSVLLKGLQEVLGNVFPILGAGSCDNFRFTDTFQIFGDRILADAAVGLIIGGHASVGVGCHHGWRPLGKPRTIDKANNNVIERISGEPAANLYQEYFGNKAEDLHSAKFNRMSLLYPLGIFVEGGREYLLRNAVAIRKDGGIVCQGDVPEGSQVHIMIGSKDSCKQAAIEAAEEAQRNLLGKQPTLIMIFESMARLKLLGRSAFEEIENIKHVLGENIPLIGMYANGEVSPFQTVDKFKKPRLLNESIVVLAIS